MQDNKYIVFKREEFVDAFTVLFDGRPTERSIVANNWIEDYAVTDATVLRPNDIFTAPTLHAYVGAVTTAIEIYERVLDIAAPAQLAEARDYFMNRAEEADHTGSRRFPD